MLGTCDCPIACDYNEFETSVSYATYPSLKVAYDIIWDVGDDLVDLDYLRLVKKNQQTKQTNGHRTKQTIQKKQNKKKQNKKKQIKKMLIQEPCYVKSLV